MDLEQTRQTIKSIKKDVDTANKLLNDIARLDKKREGNLSKIEANLTKLEQKLQGLEQLNSPIANVRNWIGEYRQSLAAEQEQLKKQFGTALDTLLKQQGLTLAGQYPRLTVGLFTLDLDFQNERAKVWYGPQQELLDQCPLAADSVAAKIEELSKKLGSNMAAEEFVRLLGAAVDRVSKSSSGQPAPIIKVLAEIAHLKQSVAYFTNPVRENFQEYSRADFSYDLFRLRETLRSQFRLTVAVRAQTKNRRDFLWIPENGQGKGSTFSYIQRIGG